MNFTPSIYQSLYPQLEALGQQTWVVQLQEILPQHFTDARHGDMPRWQNALQGLPEIEPSEIELKAKVEIGLADELGDFSPAELVKHLQVLHPWRKGPFNLFGIDINTEWRSDWKWDRLLPHIQPLSGRKVLDVGCGNGYHGWRMRGEGAELVLGIDPVMIFVMQFLAIQRYLNDSQHHLLPLRMEDLPDGMACFDSVFSMGVLYHRKAPLKHLLELKSCLRTGGELILETLVVEGDEPTVLVPEGRYAKMPNVRSIPSIAALVTWLQDAGFADVRCVDMNRTSLDEQRATQWMIEESLADFLDPHDPFKTIEGHPAPLRAIITATKP